jgi:CheY-like chemotaxis protein
MTRVLVVDDDRATTELLRDVLIDEGYVVETADNGAVAIDTMPHHPPDVVLVDLRMPIMDGVAFLHACRNDPRWSGLPIVLLSGQSERAPTSYAFDGYVSKPFDVVDLLRVVQLASS